MPYKSVDRQKEAQRASYQRNREKALEAAKQQKIANLAWLDEQRRKPCQDCEGEFPVYVMDFHHRDRSDKIMNVSTAIIVMGRQRVIEEIAKCDLVCANCHRIREHKENIRYGTTS